MMKAKSQPALAAAMLAAVALLIAGPAGAEIYKWVDGDGQVHYGDEPGGGDRSERVATPALNSYKSPEIREVKLEDRGSGQRAGKPHVTMYSADWCGYCDQARKYFRQNSIPFTEYDVENSQKGRRDYRRMGEGGVPVILVGDRKMRGFSAGAFRKLYRSQAAR